MEGIGYPEGVERQPCHRQTEYVSAFVVVGVSDSVGVEVLVPANVRSSGGGARSSCSVASLGGSY